jgi:hypothetical protein
LLKTMTKIGYFLLDRTGAWTNKQTIRTDLNSDQDSSFFSGLIRVEIVRIPNSAFTGTDMSQGCNKKPAQKKPAQ